MDLEWLADWLGVWNDYVVPVVLLVLVVVVLRAVLGNFTRRRDDAPEQR